MEGGNHRQRTPATQDKVLRAVIARALRTFHTVANILRQKGGTNPGGLNIYRNPYPTSKYNLKTKFFICIYNSGVTP